MTPVEKIISKLPDVKPAGDGQWIARCPAHENKRASLSVGMGDNGRALVHCHAGCTPKAIAAALGLALADLMPEKAGPTSKTASQAKPTSHEKPKTIYPSARDAIADLERRHGKRAGMWTYHDERSEPVGVVIRWNLPGGGKEIRPVSRSGQGWHIGGMPEPRPLYGLPELMTRTGERVLVCEGEKAADAARSIGLLATTSPHGSQSADKAKWATLAGRNVAILPDKDDAGDDYARDVAAILTKLSPPATVRRVNLPDLPNKGDVYNFIEQRRAAGADDAMIKKEIEMLVSNAKPAEAEKSATTGPILICMADVEPREVAWLWHGRIPLGRISLLVGRPSEGKSFLTTEMAARITTGTPWPDGSECPTGSVILISAEDDPGDTIRPRLDAHGADVRKVHLLSAVRHMGDKGQTYEVMFTLADVMALEDVLKATPDCRLVVVDPIGSFLGSGTDAHRDNEVRGVLAPIAKLAEKYGPAVLVVAHRRKGSGTNADEMALGSRAFTGLARAVWHLSRDEDNKARRLFLPGKNNLAHEGDGLAFSIVGDPPAVTWERDPVMMNADEALAKENREESENRPGPKPEARSQAMEWLRDLLTPGPMKSVEILEEAKAAGYSRNTTYRAKDALGIKPYKREFSGEWSWRLPDANTSLKDTQVT